MSDLPVNRRLTIPESELETTFVRAGGPGGQHVNKTSTQVQLRWNVPASAALSDRDRARLLETLASRLTDDGDLIVRSQETRSQATNREIAHKRLAALVAGALVVQKQRRATRPTAGSKRRRLDAKRRRSETKRLRRKPE